MASWTATSRSRLPWSGVARPGLLYIRPSGKRRRKSFESITKRPVASSLFRVVFPSSSRATWRRGISKSHAARFEQAGAQLGLIGLDGTSPSFHEGSGDLPTSGRKLAEGDEITVDPTTKTPVPEHLLQEIVYYLIHTSSGCRHLGGLQSYDSDFNHKNMDIRMVSH